MKTLVIILITLFVSQHIYQQYGAHNVISASMDAWLNGVHWCLNGIRHMLK